MVYKAVIFDLDGTLLNTLDDLSDSVNAVLELYGYPLHTPTEYKQKIGHGTRDLIKRSLPPDFPAERIDETEKLYKRIYAKQMMNKTRPYDGIMDLVSCLHKRGKKMAVCSNKHHNATSELINNFFGGLFDCVYGQRTGIPKKPDPTSLLTISKELGIAPSETVYVGDSKNDMLAGHNAGMLSVGVMWGFRGKNELIEGGADILLSNPQEFLLKL